MNLQSVKVEGILTYIYIYKLWSSFNYEASFLHSPIVWMATIGLVLLFFK